MNTPQHAVTTPHFKFPFQFGGRNGGALVTEQDSEDEVIDCVKVLLAYPVGSREDEPEFGVPDLVFNMRRHGSAEALHNAIQRWEPRANVVIDEEWGFDELAQHLRIKVQSQGEV